LKSYVPAVTQVTAHLGVRQRLSDGRDDPVAQRVQRVHRHRVVAVAGDCEVDSRDRSGSGLTVTVKREKSSPFASARCPNRLRLLNPRRSHVSRARARPHDSSTNVSDSDPSVTAKIALAHLNEFLDYYIRLAREERRGEARLGAATRRYLNGTVTGPRSRR
jgi:hypothetical protein